jgi:hypothetical protein
MSLRNIIADVQQFSSASQVDWQELLQFHTVIQVDADKVFSVTEVLEQLRNCDISVQPSVSLIVAFYRPDPKDQQAPLPQVALDQLRIFHHVLYGWDLLYQVLMFTAVNANNMAAEKKQTCHTCLLGPDKDKWMTAEYAQLDKHNSYGMLGAAIARCDVPPYAKKCATHLELYSKGLRRTRSKKLHGWQAASSYGRQNWQHLCRLHGAALYQVVCRVGRLLGQHR